MAARLPPGALALHLGGALLVFIAYPVLSVLARRVAVTGGGPALAHLQTVFANGYFLRSLSNTLLLGVSVMLVVTALGFALAYLVTRGPRPLRLSPRAITVAPLIAPPYLFGLVLIIIAGRSCFLARLLGTQIPIDGWPGVVAAEILSFLPGTIMGIGYLLAFNPPPLLLTGTVPILVVNIIARFLAVGLEVGVRMLHQIDVSIEEASADLGAGMLTTFRRICPRPSWPGSCSPSCNP